VPREVCDNLQALCGSLEGSEVPAALLEGAVLTRESMQAALERHGVERHDPPAGARFDPSLHEAMFTAPLSDGAAPGTVMAIPFFRLEQIHCAVQCGLELLSRPLVHIEGREIWGDMGEISSRTFLCHTSMRYSNPPMNARRMHPNSLVDTPGFWPLPHTRCPFLGCGRHTSAPHGRTVASKPHPEMCSLRS